MAATAALSVSMTTGALALENSAAQYVASAVESVASSQDLNDITRQLALFYNATAENYKAAGLPLPAEILQGIATYGKVDVSAYMNANAPETAAVSEGGQDVNPSGNDSVSWIEQEDGSSRLYKVDPSTGETKLYEGWYVDASGDKYYFENGKSVGGWIIDDGKFYHLDMITGVLSVSKQVGNFYVGEDGAALMDTTAPDGTKLAYNGSRMISKTPVEKLDEKVYIYRELLVENPDLYAEFTTRPSGSYQIVPEKANGFAWYTYAFMKLYERKEDGSIGKKLYEGDGCFRRDASIEYLNNDGTVGTMRPSAIVGSGHETWMAEHIHIDPAGFITYSEIKK